MKRAIVAGVFLLANVAGPALADACATAGHGNNLPATGTPSVASVLNPGGGVYTCYNRVSFGNPGTRENNETLLIGSGPNTPITGNFQEWHNGGSTIENEGTYTITTGSDNTSGIVTYSYTSSGPFTYFICSDTTHTPTYYFINYTNNAIVLPVVVSSGPGTC